MGFTTSGFTVKGAVHFRTTPADTDHGVRSQQTKNTSLGLNFPVMDSAEAALAMTDMNATIAAPLLAVTRRIWEAGADES